MAPSHLHAVSDPARSPQSCGPQRPTQEPLWREALGRQFRRLRHDRRETLAETAARAGVSMQYLSEMERGAKEPSSEMVAAVAGALGVTLLDLTVAVADDLLAARSVGLATAASRGPAAPRAYLLAA